MPDGAAPVSDLLNGIRVVELGLFALVPAAAAVLAEWGADVVKIEHPVQGDPVRGLAAWGIKPGTGGFSYMWEVCNRGKRSVGLDVAHPDGRELLLSMLERADVFLTSFLPAASIERSNSRPSGWATSRPTDRFPRLQTSHM